MRLTMQNIDGLLALFYLVPTVGHPCIAPSTTLNLSENPGVANAPNILKKPNIPIRPNIFNAQYAWHRHCANEHTGLQ